MFSIMSRAAKSAHDSDAVIPTKTGTQNTLNAQRYHVWIFRLSILVGILILIALIFIKFPANLVLFVVSLFVFLAVSFWYHVMVRRKKRAEQSHVSSSRGFPRDHSSFVDVPLDQFNDANTGGGVNGLKHQQFVSA